MAREYSRNFLGNHTMARAEFAIPRRSPASPSASACVGVQVGSIMVGGAAPIVVQSMTNTDTADIAATTAQVAELAQAGSELVRVTVNNEEAAAAVPVDPRAPGCARDLRPADRRFSFQRPSVAEQISRLRRGCSTNTASIPATSGAAKRRTSSSPPSSKSPAGMTNRCGLG
jgi:hypothetical protein